MTREFATNRSPDSEWGVANLRLTVFFRPNPTLNCEGLWDRVVGQPPDSSTGKPKTGERIELGPVENMQLVLNANPLSGRIDWQLISVDLTTDLETIPHAGQQFLDLMSGYLRSDGLPPLTRMALGAVFLLPVGSVEQGYSRLCDYLPFDIDRAMSSDFMYQINRKRKSATLDEVEINRLMKWSVAMFARHEITAVGIGNEPTVSKFSCNLELDINTTPLNDATLETGTLPDLLSELFTLAREIIREGDVQ